MGTAIAEPEFISDAIRALAHSQWHQRTDFRCARCQGQLLKVNRDWYCCSCLRIAEVVRCPLCGSLG